METETAIKSEPMDTFRLRLPKQDVEGLRRLARSESQRLQCDIGWCEIVRGAIRKMATEQTPVQ